MFKKLFGKIANKYGYYKLSQLKVGGNCGCCGKWMENFLYVHENNIVSGYGICGKCKQIKI